MPYWENWSGNQKSSPLAILYPTTEQEIVDIVKKAKQENRSVRVAGTGHSWAPLIAGSDYIVSLDRYKKILKHDDGQLTITCEAGAKLHEIALYANQLGWSLPNISFLDVQIMGAIVSTTTHGCGRQQQLLAEHITNVRLINGLAQVVDLDKNNHDFHALKAGLGLLGLVSTMTIQCQPAKSVVSINKVMSNEQWLAQFEILNQQADFFDVWWLPHTNNAYVMAPKFVDENYPEATRTNQRFWDRFGDRGISMLQRLGTHLPFLIPWLNRLAFALGFRDCETKGPLYQILGLGTPVKYRIYNCEYAFPVEIGTKVLQEIKTLTDSKQLMLPCLFDVRTVKADQNYLSLAYEGDVMTIGCTINSEAKKVPAILYEVEKIYKKYEGRPHLCKVFTADYNYLEKCYPRLSEFQKVAERYDPQAIFRTQALTKLLWGE